MNLIIQASNANLLCEHLVSSGLGESVGAAKGDVGAILLAVSSALQSSPLWSSMVLKLTEAFAGYFKDSAAAQDKIVIELPDHSHIEITSSNLEASLSTLHKFKLLRFNNAR